MKYTLSEMARVTRGRVDLTPTKDEQQAAHEWLCKVDPDYAGRVQLTSDESQEVVDAAIEARVSEDLEDVPVSDWKAGDTLICVKQVVEAEPVGTKVVIEEIDGEFVTLKESRSVRTFTKGSLRADSFRARRSRQNPAFVNGVIDLSKAVVGSKWKARDGRCVMLQEVDLSRIYSCRFSGCFSGHLPNGHYTGDQGVHKNDIIAPWKD